LHELRKHAHDIAPIAGVGALMKQRDDHDHTHAFIANHQRMQQLEKQWREFIRRFFYSSLIRDPDPRDPVALNSDTKTTRSA